MTYIIELDADTTIANQKVDELENKVDNVVKLSDRMLLDVDNKTDITFNKVMTATRAGYSMVMSLITAAGGTVDVVFQSIIAAAFSTVGILYPLFVAQALTPGMQLQAIMGFMQLELAIISIVAAQQKQQDIINSLQKTSNVINSTGIFLGTLSF